MEGSEGDPRSSQEQDEKRIFESMGRIYRAFLESNVAELDQLLSDDFTFSDPSGPVASKERWLADIASGELVFNSIEVDRATFQHLGDRVIVEGHATLDARYSRCDYRGKFRYLGVYAKDGDEWILRLTSAERV